MSQQLIQFIGGMTTMGFLVAAVFFAKFWTKTRDRLFGIFGIAFTLLGVERVILLFIQAEDETRTYVYFMRLLAFILIIIGIVDKNRQK